MKKCKLKIKRKVLLSVIVFTITLGIYLLLGFLGAYKDVTVIGSIFVCFGWFWLLAGQIIGLIAIWRK